MNKNEILNKLRIVKPLLQQKYGVNALALFGSYSRNEQSENSDIDIMVDFNKPLGMEYFELVYMLRHVFHEHKVEVVTKQGIMPKYYERLKQDLVYA